MQVSLLVVHGVHQGKEIAILPSHFCIGRDESCEFCDPNMAVSRRHAAILVRQDRVLVCDLGSRNGTFVNGFPVTSEQEVRHNDQLCLGPLELRVLIRPQPFHPLDRPTWRADKPAEERPAFDGDLIAPRLRLPGAGLETPSSTTSNDSPPEWATFTASANLLNPGGSGFPA